MKVDIISEKRNDLLRRRELDVQITECPVTPARKDIAASLAAKLGVNDAAVLLDKVRQEYGKKSVRCVARVYETPELLKKHEPAYLLERGKPKAKKEEAAPAPEAKKEEKK